MYDDVKSMWLRYTNKRKALFRANVITYDDERIRQRNGIYGAVRM